MKYRILTPTALLLTGFLSTQANAGMSYDCWSYKGGKLGKMVNVIADNRSDAANLAAVKFNKLNISFDSVNCK